MSNSLWFSRIFTLQSFSWFCFKFFWLFLRCTWTKITSRVRIFYNHWIWKFSKFQFFSFPFLIFILFKITSNSFIYSLVEQFLETHFHKNNFRVRRVYFWEKLAKIFRFIYLLTWGVRVYYTNNISSTPIDVLLRSPPEIPLTREPPIFVFAAFCSPSDSIRFSTISW